MVWGRRAKRRAQLEAAAVQTRRESAGPWQLLTGQRARRAVTVI